MLSKEERNFIRKFCADNYAANAALDDIDELRRMAAEAVALTEEQPSLASWRAEVQEKLDA